jgi:hypothetical protein
MSLSLAPMLISPTPPPADELLSEVGEESVKRNGTLLSAAKGTEQCLSYYTPR